jgi:hypothetical protein
LREEAENADPPAWELYARRASLVKLGAAGLGGVRKMSGEGVQKVTILGTLPLDRRKKSAYNRAV